MKVRLGSQRCRNKSETIYDHSQDGESGCFDVKLNGAWLCHIGSGRCRGSHLVETHIILTSAWIQNSVVIAFT